MRETQTHEHLLTASHNEGDNRKQKDIDTTVEYKNNR
jgi:hypothetical protein